MVYRSFHSGELPRYVQSLSTLLIAHLDFDSDHAYFYKRREQALQVSTVFPRGRVNVFKYGSGYCLLGTLYEVRTTRHNCPAWCQYNVTGWDAMWAYDMLSE